MTDCSTASRFDADVDARRFWSAGWRRYVFPGLWLVYLAQVASGVHKHSHGPAAVTGYGIIGLFALCYLLALPEGWHNSLRRFWPLYGACLALTATGCFFAHQDAVVFLVYVSVLTVAALGERATAISAGYAVVAAVLPPLVPSWHAPVDWGDGLAVLLVSVALLGFFTIMRTNMALSAARAEIARLAAENERSRIARDLHDLLGHSLTTITVKAGLARRLAETGSSDHALAEIREVETLSRRTLGDVRAAVAGQREVTLVGELATAREVLRATDVDAELPGSVDVIGPELSEVFGWVLREAVTNVVRHSHAQHCRVELGPGWIEITDDGTGSSGNGTGTPGNGLAGLGERLAAVGGQLQAGPAGDGWRLRAEVPPRPAAAGEPVAVGA